MYRSQDTPKLNNDEDENCEFTGATLTINETVYKNIQGNNNDDGGGVNKIIAQGVTAEDSLKADSDGNANVEVRPKIGSPAHFFSFRSGQFEKAVDDIVNILLRPTNDTNILGKWLLTEISHWDHERERVFILTSKTLLLVKYDFIALRILHHNKIRLTQVDTISRGKLTYPESSLVPRIEGITNGIQSIVQGSLFPQQQTTGSIITNKPSETAGTRTTANNNMALVNRFDFSHFKPVERSDIGVRIMWNRGQPISFLTSWNPFATDIPWITFKDHPLFNYQDPFNSPSIQENLNKNREIYSADNLYDILARIFSNGNDLGNAEVNYSCLLQEEPIIMQNYVGIGAVIHNKNNFGFFKVRGKFSF